MTTFAPPFLGGLNVAILVTNGFEQAGLTGPRQALEESGAVLLNEATQRLLFQRMPNHTTFAVGEGG